MLVSGIAAADSCTTLLTSPLALLSRNGAVSGASLNSFKLFFKGLTSLLLKEMPAVELRPWLGLDPHPPAPQALAGYCPALLVSEGTQPSLGLALIPSEPASQSCMVVK